MGYMGKSGAPGRNFARNLRVRSAALYTLSYGSVEMVRRDGSAPSASSVSVRRSTIDLPAHWCRTPDLHRDCSRSGRDASAGWASAALVRNGCPASIRTMTTWFRARQAACYLTGQKWSQRPVTLRHPPLYKSGEIACPSTLAEKAEAGGHAPHSTKWNDLFSKQSRHACPVQLPIKMVGRHGAAPCSAV